MSAIDGMQGNLFGDAPFDAIRPAPRDEHSETVARRLPRSLRLGTSTWSYPGWDGLVWDKGAAKLTESNLSRRGLPAYSAHPLLRSAGIDRSYYAPLTETECRAYAEQVPDDFRFVMKADRSLVLPELPAAAGAAPVLNDRFLNADFAMARVVSPAIAGFGSKLGAVVFQFSPIGPLRISQLGGPTGFADRLHDFLASLPIGPEYTIEIRDPSLLTDQYASALLNSGASHCFTVHPKMPPISEQSRAVDPASQRITLVRWMLNPWLGMTHRQAESRYTPFNRTVDDDDQSRRDIVDLIRHSKHDARYVIVSNNAEGAAPVSIRRLAEQLAAESGNP